MVKNMFIFILVVFNKFENKMYSFHNNCKSRRILLNLKIIKFDVIFSKLFHLGLFVFLW
jgi:hypothetical protein